MAKSDWNMTHMTGILVEYSNGILVEYSTHAKNQWNTSGIVTEDWIH